MAYDFLKGTSRRDEIILQATMRKQVLATFCLIILTWGFGKGTAVYVHRGEICLLCASGMRPPLGEGSENSFSTIYDTIAALLETRRDLIICI